MKKQLTHRKKLVRRIGSGVLALGLLSAVGVQPASAYWGYSSCTPGSTGQTLQFAYYNAPNITYRPGQFCLLNGPYKAVFQTDSNFVVYKNGVPLWHTRTNGRNASMLAVQGDGNIVMYGQSMNVLWQTNTSGPRNYEFKLLRMQSDGNLVMYTQYPWRAVWQTGTEGR
ncbi:hypothetical protein J3A64_003019 [Pseudarthrobacter sp. PvP004]|uniref:mannose-binding protein n=1 Tax=Pseudarthrobacter sp. PvP004 TaxID=2817850 RepID=UPI001AE86848|nr:mannose-binding protein [Pseudarthrobacter sp. PvP004]MBP2267555.1 hypothetical protein [Pseudarthrobacter sp. PvP004]